MLLFLDLIYEQFCNVTFIDDRNLKAVLPEFYALIVYDMVLIDRLLSSKEAKMYRDCACISDLVRRLYPHSHCRSFVHYNLPLDVDGTSVRQN